MTAPWGLALLVLLCAEAASSEKVSEVSDPTGDMISIPAQLVRVGSDDTKHNKNADGEGPSRLVNVRPFLIDKSPVTNAQFKRFVRDTKYKTEAEMFGWSFVLSSLASEKTLKDPETQALPDAKHWLASFGAWWRAPEGKGSSIKGKENYPVLHISYNDAVEYCKWAKKRLPTESEWETAARGGLASKKYPWGDTPTKGGKHMMNIWQGTFPENNTEEDGYFGAAPVDAYPPNAYGMLSMVGNVWEWTQTLFSEARPNKKGEEQAKYVLRGGSFVDSVDGSFNHMARVTTRMGNTADSGSHNTGFRCARNGKLGDPIPDKPRGPGGRAAMDQDKLQEIIAEKGVEGLQEYMKEVGMDGNVMTAGELRKRQEQLKEARARLEEDEEL
eukprot:Sspe_Gene.27666::Locus_12030_Transcript_2_2_Confidence_0.400_Length_1351::g.27666::m.27666